MRKGDLGMEAFIAASRGLSDADSRFASEADYAFCRRIQKRYGVTYYFATMRFRPEIRRRTHAVYAFVRIPDQWVDDSPEWSAEQKLQRLDGWQKMFLQGLEGVEPSHPVMRAFCDVAQDCSLSVDEPLAFLDAMRLDVEVDRYNSYEDLRQYMRGSAVSVALMMNAVIGCTKSGKAERAASALAEAMQLTNFLRDVGEDARRGRIYLPLEDLQAFCVSEDEILAGEMSASFRELMKFEIARARALYAQADQGFSCLPETSRSPIRLARVLYARILDRIEQNDYDVFNRRARTGSLEKLAVACREWCRCRR